MNDLEFRHSLQIDVTILEVWVDQGWLVPDRTERGLDFREADVARGRLILDLIETMGVNEAGVDVVMDLVDQVHGLRGTLHDLIEAVRVQDQEIQQRIRSDIDRAERGSRS